MKLVIDTETNRLMAAGPEGVRDLPLYSQDGFDVLSKLWMKVGWNQNFQSTFTWCGQPILELPADLLLTQEVIAGVKPNVVVQTGLAHSGLLLFLASLLRTHGGGKVVGVDGAIAPELQQAVQATHLAADVTLVQGEIIAEATMSQVMKEIPADARVMVLLTSSHSKSAVREELEAYAKFVTVGSYIVATGGVLQEGSDTPRGKPEWKDDHPAAAGRTEPGRLQPELGGRRQHRTDRLSAAVKADPDPEMFTRRYQALLAHYGLQAQAIQHRRRQIGAPWIVQRRRQRQNEQQHARKLWVEHGSTNLLRFKFWLWTGLLWCAADYRVFAPRRHGGKRHG